MNYALYAGLLSLGLCLAMVLLLEVGRRIGVRRFAKDSEGARHESGTIEGAMLALLGLLLAFTVAGAGNRFDVRRDLVVQETNNIATAYLRLDVLPEAARAALQETFRRYLDARLAIYRKLTDVAAADDARARATRLQGEIWRQAVAGVRAEGVPPQAMAMLLPPLNAMFDITTTRTMAMQKHPPTIIFVLLFGLALVSSLFSGYGMGYGMAGGKARSLMHMLCFALIVSITVYVILDLEYPRLGLIRVDDFDQALVDLRKKMD